MPPRLFDGHATGFVTVKNEIFGTTGFSPPSRVFCFAGATHFRPRKTC